ncbi:MAG TPA: GH1 family beta-glucosidase [Candidatus Angelobacter sp.]|nr:GH1 family beta-glucosidase [Candidatus Angelobacter sp.]
MTSTPETPAAPGRPFPDGFVWGAATAAFQIEGATGEGGRGPSIWDTLCARPGAILDGSDGSVACDHYHRWESDLDLLVSLGLTAYRFSIAWPRVMATGRGTINETGLAFYDRLVDGMLERGITPYATLYHWDLPQALEDDGGWRNRDTAYRFADYAAITQFRLGDRVRHWATLNEPWCSAFLGHASGEHAPGRTDPAEALTAAHHLLLGHGLAAQALHGGRRPAQVGIVLNLYDVTPGSDAPADLDAARRVDGLQNRWFLDPVLRGSYPDDVVADLAAYTDLSFVQDGDLATIATRLDWLGVNYYSSFQVRGLDAAVTSGDRPTPWVGTEDVEVVDRGLRRTRMGWDIVPEGLTATLVRLDREYDVPPILITENGSAWEDEVVDGEVHDPERIEYLDEHLAAILTAIADGVDVRGYFAWSLLDNFEWAWGYSRRFGIVYVDFGTQERTVKDSGRHYASIAAANALPELRPVRE